MTDKALSKRWMVESSSKPRLANFMKLRRDETRDRWVLLAPERVLTPDEIAIEILKRCDGTKTIATLATELGSDYNAPEETIRSDMIEMLQGLADKGYVIEDQA